MVVARARSLPTILAGQVVRLLVTRREAPLVRLPRGWPLLLVPPENLGAAGPVAGVVVHLRQLRGLAGLVDSLAAAAAAVAQA